MCEVFLYVYTIRIWSVCLFFFFLMIRRPPRSTHCISSAASDVYKRQYQRRVHGTQFQFRILKKNNNMEQGKRTKEATSGSINTSGLIGGDFVITPNNPFIDVRLKVYEQALEIQKQMFSKLEKHPIKITLKDGEPIDGEAFKTTPAELLLKLPKKLQEQMIVARVKYSKKYDLEFNKKCISADTEEENQPEKKEKEQQEICEIIDLSRPLEGDCKLEFLNIQDPIGLQTFYHSSAHILGQALEQYFGGYLCVGPALQQGFYYDIYIGNYNISSEEYPKIEEVISKILTEKQQFERIYVTKSLALEMFSHNPFKKQLISNKVPDGGYVTVYKCGKFIDLCTGPHLPNSKLIKAFKLTKNSSAYWLSKNTNDSLQRVYGISFTSKKELDEYVKKQEELAKRDHRNIGTKGELFMFHNFAPGSAFFYPAGACIYNKLVEFMRKQLKIRGYTEVVTPNLFESTLWKTSGHWDKYLENMFMIKEPDATFGLKPMNCPGHFLMFDSIARSYRELPIRYADFGVLHRNEVRGALSGLTRVVRFQQDDSHIFCRMDQLQDEILGCLDLVQYVYTAFGFNYELNLSTMPEKHIGDKEVWDNAISQLKTALDKFGKPYKINEGDGAFYGPKIDLTLQDAYGRRHQCGTVQVDFNGPIRFNLQYKTKEFIDKQTKDDQEEGEEKEKELISKCYFASENKEMKTYDEVLQLQVYLEGDGYALGNKDKEVFKMMQNQHIDKVLYPNLYRWFNFVSKQIKE
eukprot:TRINITY_DN816_c0_g1_i4.p1 TRINITY_DN816_c0_g1~~TRINITY_DN816_c0_g1_i4.p1  ORF type:complete len:748 (+),score=168.04 TRINITY_DN816_c0_g1_i4:70-2313(+)